MQVYWKGPSVGFDVGGNASKCFTLVYNLREDRRLFQRFPGVEGSIYFVAGLGINYQRSGGVTLAPMRTGVGLRAGVNAQYQVYSDQPRLVPALTWRGDGALALRIALGAFALGALAVGALAIGYVAIGRLAVNRAAIKRLEIDELVVRRHQPSRRRPKPVASSAFRLRHPCRRPRGRYSSSAAAT